MNPKHKYRYTTSAQIKRSKRPGPIASAADTKLGKRSRGNDGKMYVVKMDKRGVQRWVRSSGTVKSRKSVRKYGWMGWPDKDE